jgi:NTP pyrophosphatase (non-canonical NTP hydrolase)
MAKFHFGSKVFPSLIKVTEEAGEFIQAAMKVIGSRQWVDPWPRKADVDNLREEACDLQATLIFLFQKNPELYDPKRISEKLIKFERWHEEQADG